MWYSVESRDENKGCNGVGVGAFAALTGLVVVDLAPFLSQWRLQCEGQGWVERQASSGWAERDVEMYLEVQLDEEKCLNQNSCPDHNVEWKEQLYKPLAVRMSSPRAHRNCHWVPHWLLKRAQVFVYLSRAYQQGTDTRTFSLCPPHQCPAFPLDRGYRDT